MRYTIRYEATQQQSIFGNPTNDILVRLTIKCLVQVLNLDLDFLTNYLISHDAKCEIDHNCGN